jgi:DNA-binding MarR family transcriptional regulator
MMKENDFASKEMIQQTIDRFWESLPPAWSRVREHLRLVVSANCDITVEQFHVLRHIWKGSRTISDLATAKQISRPAISQAVEVLVEKGLITRRQSRADRRYVELELTDSGLALLNQIFALNRAWMAEKMSVLTTGEAESIQSGLAALRKAIDSGSTN